jgi:hypothetical protein
MESTGVYWIAPRSAGSGRITSTALAGWRSYELTGARAFADSDAFQLCNGCEDRENGFPEHTARIDVLFSL